MTEIQTLAVVGAGSMGWSIASLAALAGYRTILEDILPASLRRAESEIRSHLAQAIAQSGLSKGDAASALGRLEYAATVEEAARQADLVIENVPDELESKLEIFTLLDKICKPHTILACTTATFRVSEIASITYRAGNILGMRFVHPAHEAETLELVRGLATSDETMAACAEVGRRMGAGVVVIAEAAPAP